VPQELPDS